MFLILGYLLRGLLSARLARYNIWNSEVHETIAYCTYPAKVRSLFCKITNRVQCVPVTRAAAGAADRALL